MTQTYRRRAAISAALAAFGFGSFLQTQTASAQRVRPDNDYDNDGINNKVDRDDDNDGVRDKRDRDDDNDGIRDKRDRDDDNDGIRDQNDRDSARRPQVRGRTWVEPRLEYRFDYRPLRYDDRHYDDLDAYDLGFGFDRPDFYDHFERDYMRFDRNGDGRLSYGERRDFWIHMATMGMFGRMSRGQAHEMGVLAASLDSNGNGRLTQYELRRLSRFIKARQLFIAFDRNRDGRLMRRETRGWMFNQFRDLDLNRDRTVTMYELRGYFLGTARAHYWAR